MKTAIKPYYQKKEITKEEYKEIVRKAVEKVRNSHNCLTVCCFYSFLFSYIVYYLEILAYLILDKSRLVFLRIIPNWQLIFVVNLTTIV